MKSQYRHHAECRLPDSMKIRVQLVVSVVVLLSGREMVADAVVFLKRR